MDLKKRLLDIYKWYGFNVETKNDSKMGKFVQWNWKCENMVIKDIDNIKINTLSKRKTPIEQFKRSRFFFFSYKQGITPVLSDGGSQYGITGID